MHWSWLRGHTACGHLSHGSIAPLHPLWLHRGGFLHPSSHPGGLHSSVRQSFGPGPRAEQHATVHPFTLLWRPWRHTSIASAGAFTFKVLVRLKNVPAHARSVSIAEHILGTSCASIEIAPLEVIPEDDDHKLFVAAWCIHPRLVPDERIMAILEPLFLGALEDMTELPALRYLVRCRVVEFQDWSITRHTSNDDDGHGRADNDDDGDSGDSNHNHYHPGLNNGGCRLSWGPKSVRLAAAGDDAPSLSNGRGPTFRSRRTVLVGSFACPVIESRAIGCQAAVQCAGTRAVAAPEFPAESGQAVKSTADPSLCLHRLLDADLRRSVDPMLSEAAM